MNPIQRFFQEDIPATFSAGKWRLDLLQLNTHFTQLDRQKNILLGELGTKAWSSKIKHDGYGTLSAKLDELDGLVEQVQGEINSLQNKINLESEHLKTTNLDFDTRLKAVQAQRQVASQKLAELQTGQRNLQQSISQLQAIISQGDVNLRAFQSQIIQLQAADQVDKEARIASLHSTSQTVQTQINDANLQINSKNIELTANDEQQIPLKNEIEGCNQETIRLQEQNKAAVAPIQQQLKSFQQELLKVTEKKNGLLSQISAKMTEFGGQVYKFHPTAEALGAEYARLDANQTEIKTVNDQINLTQAHLSTVNAGSLTKVGVVIGGLVVFIVFVVIMIGWVISTVANLLKPDPKASIRLVQNWTLENCNQGVGSTNGMYIDVSVWENRRTDAIASVETETKLIGANQIVLDSHSDSLQIAPGGQFISLDPLSPNGSRVQQITRSVSSVYFDKVNFVHVNNLDVSSQFEKSPSSNNPVLTLEITNKSDFGLAPSAPNVPYVFVVDKQNKLIDVLASGFNVGPLSTDSISKIVFNGYWSNGLSCVQKDYSKQAVTFWYFVPLQIANSPENQFVLTGKADYNP